MQFKHILNCFQKKLAVWIFESNKRNIEIRIKKSPIIDYAERAFLIPCFDSKEILLDLKKLAECNLLVLKPLPLHPLTLRRPPSLLERSCELELE